jgi:hypothetical protein
MRKYFEMDKMWYYLNWSEAPVLIDNSQTEVGKITAVKFITTEFNPMSGKMEPKF